jgi:hypothetical protein
VPPPQRAATVPPQREPVSQLKEPRPAMPPAEPKTPSKPAAPARESQPAAQGDASAGDLQQKWEEVLAAIKPQNRNLEAILKAGTMLGLDNGVIVLGFPYDFHKSKAEEPKSKQLLEEVLSIKLSMPLKVRCEIVKGEGKRMPVRPKDKKQVAMEDPLVKAMVTKYNARIADVEDVGPEEPPDE